MHQDLEYAWLLDDVPCNSHYCWFLLNSLPIFQTMFYRLSHNCHMQHWKWKQSAHSCCFRSLSSSLYGDNFGGRHSILLNKANDCSFCKSSLQWRYWYPMGTSKNGRQGLVSWRCYPFSLIPLFRMLPKSYRK